MFWIAKVNYLRPVGPTDERARFTAVVFANSVALVGLGLNPVEAVCTTAATSLIALVAAKLI
jgi:hypothetical protein